MSTTLEKILANPELYQYDVPTLGECKIASPVRHNEFISEKDRILVTENTSVIRYLTEKLGHEPGFERAGPHARIYHDPNWTRVGILTAGGLCPGLNNVIKGLVEILSFDYGIKTIFGIRFGYAGLNPKFGYQPMMLDPDVVDTIHEHGGTILGSSRGQQPTEEIVDTLVRMNINILFVIGGEKRGLSKEMLAASDETVRIDYGRVFKESLSAASATAILAFAVLDRNS